MTKRQIHALFTVALLLCVLAGAWWLDVQTERQDGSAQYRHWSYEVRPSSVESWMTFNYLNRLFNLAPEYLQTRLVIQDERYPNISIQQYAVSHDIDPAAFLLSVRAAIASTTDSQSDL